MSEQNYWLVKSEPKTYSISDLQREQVTIWDGVRNYQARNFLRQMQMGDRVFFYHSNTIPPGIVGLAEVSSINIDDPTQFDPQSKYFDPKSSLAAPRWQTVQIKFLAAFSQMITLETLKQKFTPEELQVVKTGNRLSVLPVAGSIAAKIKLLQN
jgi:predicted RNA-binding protein with PUA-like domain